ncbi:MAG: hypothetical protein WC637_07760, partial [Victivallales bacterium]
MKNKLSKTNWLHFLAGMAIPVIILSGSASAQQSKAPVWDAGGKGLLPRQGVACVYVSADGKNLVVGTIAPTGDPNVIMLGPDGKLLRSWTVGLRWIQDVVSADGVVFAMNTTPDETPSASQTAFLCREKPVKVGVSLVEYDYPWTSFHYGKRSNHSGSVLRPYSKGAVGLWRGLVCWMTTELNMDSGRFQLRLPPNAVTVGLSTSSNGEALVGCATRLDGKGEAQPNLFLVRAGEQKALWIRMAKP